MPKANVATPFNFREGGKVGHFKKGEQELTPAALTHAFANRFLVEPEPEAAPAPGKK
ncbi:hypothetical protein ACQKFS_02555 [Pseudomonas guineae]|uniref:hypothetical protein n=1 Tax=Pseudomonas guineae TaxID=425504 RepID=UPI003D079598